MLTRTHSLVVAYSKRGEKLLLEAATIGDQEGFRFWQHRKASWVAEAVSALKDDVDADTLRSFQVTLRQSPSEGAIYEDLPVELEGLRRGIAVLRGLAEQTARRS